jgi:hypothetical protein
MPTKITKITKKTWNLFDGLQSLAASPPTGRAVDIQPATFVGFVLFVALRASAGGAVVSSCRRLVVPARSATVDPIAV